MALKILEFFLVSVNSLLGALFLLYSPDFGGHVGIWSILSYFGISFVLAVWRPRIWLLGILLVLPLSTDFYRHFSIYTNSHFIFDSILTTFLVLGSWFGIKANRILELGQGPLFYLKTKQLDSTRSDLSSRHAVFVLLFFVTYGLAIWRAVDINLFSSATGLSLKGLLLHIGNATRLTPTSDLYFLRELQALASAGLLGILMVDTARHIQIRFSAIATAMLLSGFIIAIVGIASKYFHFGFYQVGQTRGINSIFPDIHSFASYALMIVILGFTRIRGAIAKRQMARGASSLICTIVCGYAVYLSGSRFTLFVFALLSVIGLLLIGMDLIRSRKGRLVGIAVILVGLISGGTQIDFSGPSENSRYHFKSIYNGLSSLDYPTINRTLSWRPEVFNAAIRLAQLYPAFGVGAANFYRYGGEFDLGQSRYLTSSNGENAHNYFLQVVSERGIIGLLAFLALILLVLCKKEYRFARDRYTVSIVMYSLLLGNLFGHTLLIWYFQVLFWLLVFWSGTLECKNVDNSQESTNAIRVFGIAVASIIAIFAADTVWKSHSAIGYGRFCYKESYWPEDSAASGMLSYKGIVENRIEKVKAIEPLHRDLLVSLQRPEENLRSKRGETSLIELDSTWKPLPSLSVNGKAYLSRCYVPMNFGENLDQRRLGFRFQ